jgi:molybdopterin-guanine dinucleotide biosynthesis protein A
MTGIILAGGESRRMGRDKAFLEVSGRPIIEHILAVFADLFDRTVIVTRWPERFGSCRADVVRDALETPGPLTGIYTGLMHSQDDLNFVAACDMPYLDRGLIRHMQRLADGHDAVVPRVGSYLEPLHAIYRKRIAPVIEAQVRTQDLRIRGIFDHIRVRYMTQDEIAIHDPEQRSFRNLNTHEEYKEAVCSDWECRN